MPDSRATEVVQWRLRDAIERRDTARTEITKIRRLLRGQRQYDEVGEIERQQLASIPGVQVIELNQPDDVVKVHEALFAIFGE
jgi:hypothetical protein